MTQFANWIAGFILVLSSIRLMGQNPASIDPSFTPSIFPSWTHIAVRPDGDILCVEGENVITAATVRRIPRDGGRPIPFGPAVTTCEICDGAGGYQASVYLEPNGGVLIKGKGLTVGNRPAPPHGLIRLNANGTAAPPLKLPDLAYVVNGPVSVSVTGRILLSGSQSLGLSLAPTILRPDGSPDGSFVPDLEWLDRNELGGSVVATFHVEESVLVAGMNSGFRIGHLQRDGKPDLAFGVRTLKSSRPPGTYPNAVQLLTLQNGGIVAALTEATVVSLDGREELTATLWRLNRDGSTDEIFAPPRLTGGGIRQVAELRDGKLLLGGTFTQINGVVRRGLARLNTDGSVDEKFDPGIWFQSADQQVLQFALQPDHRILVLSKLFGEHLILFRIWGDQIPWLRQDELWRKLTGGDPRALLFTLRPGTGYAIEAASSLSPPDWHEIEVREWGACPDGDCGGLVGVSDVSGASQVERFYRVVAR